MNGLIVSSLSTIVGRDDEINGFHSPSTVLLWETPGSHLQGLKYIV